MRDEAARIGMMRGISRARGGPEGLRTLFGIFDRRKNFFSRRINEIFFLQTRKNVLFIVLRNGGSRIFQNCQDRTAQSVVADLFGSFDYDAVGRLNNNLSLAI